MHPTAGHFGIKATTLRAAQRFYWPGMASNLKREIKKCDICLARQTRVNTHEAIHKGLKHGYPGEIVYIDLVGPLPRSDKGNRYITTIQYGFSRYATAIPIPNKEAITLANAVLEGFITKFGCTIRIHTDQGTEF